MKAKLTILIAAIFCFLILLWKRDFQISPFVLIVFIVALVLALAAPNILLKLRPGHARKKMPNHRPIYKCPKCGAHLKKQDGFCYQCGAKVRSSVLPENIETVYTDDSKTVLKKMIQEEFLSQSYTTAALNRKQNWLLLGFGIYTFLIMILYFFNYSIFLCLLLEAVGILIYYLLSKRWTLVNTLVQQAVKNPDQDIPAMIAKAKQEQYQPHLSQGIKLTLTLMVAILLPVLCFFQARVWYVPYQNGYAVFRYTRGIINEEEVTIVEQYHGKPVVAIGSNAFKNATIKAVYLPDTLESIKASAFRNCYHLEQVTIPSSVVEIRGSAFENCTNLRMISLPEGLKEIRGRAFKNNKKLQSVILPSSLEYLGGNAFAGCRSLVTIMIPDGISEIYGGTFSDCTSLESIYLPDDITAIHAEAFRGDINLKQVTLPSKITEIRANTFENCRSLTSITIPTGVRRIAAHAFEGCSRLSYVFVPSSVEEIGSSAFRRCDSLYTIDIPNTTQVNDRAFKESPTTIRRY